MYERAREFFGVDEEGDALVQIVLVDRTRFSSMNYAPIPFTFPIEPGTDEAWDLKRRLMLNLRLATTDLDSWWKTESWKIDKATKS